jgi:hypothetical protein
MLSHAELKVLCYSQVCNLRRRRSQKITGMFMTSPEEIPQAWI